MIKKIIIGFSLLYILLLVAFCEAQAAKPFVEIGISRYQRPECSLWHHDCGATGYETHWDMDRPMWRIGVNQHGWRLSYFDLGKYSIAADAADDESCVLNGGTIWTCTGDRDWYYTQGSMRGWAATYRTQTKLFLELGPAYFRQHLKVEKDDGYSLQEKVDGWGYVVGIGWELSRALDVGLYRYSTPIGAGFGNHTAPAGVGDANILSLSYRFR